MRLATAVTQVLPVAQINTNLFPSTIIRSLAQADTKLYCCIEIK